MDTLTRDIYFFLVSLLDIWRIPTVYFGLKHYLEVRPSYSFCYTCPSNWSFFGCEPMRPLRPRRPCIIARRTQASLFPGLAISLFDLLSFGTFPLLATISFVPRFNSKLTCFSFFSPLNVHIPVILLYLASGSLCFIYIWSFLAPSEHARHVHFSWFSRLSWLLCLSFLLVLSITIVGPAYPFLLFDAFR